MTTFAPSQIPADITTVEALVVWAGMVLQDVNFDESIREVTNGEQLPVASATPFNIRSQDFNGVRTVVRASIPMNINYATANGVWNSAQELSTGAIPAAYQA